jgi:hypothetical protein
MTSLNKSVANSPDGNILSMFEYWQLMESSVYTQQAETGLYNPMKVVTSREATPVSGNLAFQVSPGSRFAVNDLHNAYLYLEVERNFVFTTGGAIVNPLLTLIGDKQSANFIDQYFVCCNDIEITENRDFVFETNILGATISDSIKLKQPETYTPIGWINSIGNSRSTSFCGVVTDFNGIATNSTVSYTYAIKIPMTSLTYLTK